MIERTPKMRTEEEMYYLILQTAREDERIRAVYLNGSRANGKVTKDMFQDYDIVYVVKETKPFYQDKEWIGLFGEILYMQMPEHMDAARTGEQDFSNTYGWLMQFEDGNRIDLHVMSIPYAKKNILEDKLCIILLDKDKLLPPIPPSTDEDYYVQRPDKVEFDWECNEFWWCLNNVAKGIWREEVPYVMDMVNSYVRPRLISLLSWQIGIETGFSCSVGKSGKYMKQYMKQEVWSRFLKTYSSAEKAAMWQAVFIMCDLFDEAGKEIADRLGFEYNTKEAQAGKRYLEYVYQLDLKAERI